MTWLEIATADAGDILAILLHFPKCNIFYYLTEFNFLTKL